MSDTDQSEERYDTESSVSSYDGHSLHSFREKLLRAKIDFDDHLHRLTPPPHVSELIAFLIHWPLEMVISESESSLDHEDSLTEDERHDIQAAIDSARLVSNTDINSCRGRNKAPWMRLVNNALLNPLFEAERQELLSSGEQLEWTEGGINNPGYGLDNPRPDCAFGLAASWSEESDPLSLYNLFRMGKAVGTQLAFSPSLLEWIVFPAVIYEAGDSRTCSMALENKAAVGAARALSLLEELSRLSEVPYQHCVVVVISSGSSWDFHVAYREEDYVVSLTSEAQLSDPANPVTGPCAGFRDDDKPGDRTP